MPQPRPRGHGAAGQCTARHSHCARNPACVAIADSQTRRGAATVCTHARAAAQPHHAAALHHRRQHVVRCAHPDELAEAQQLAANACRLRAAGADVHVPMGQDERVHPDAEVGEHWVWGVWKVWRAWIRAGVGRRGRHARCAVHDPLQLGCCCAARQQQLRGSQPQHAAGLVHHLEYDAARLGRRRKGDGKLPHAASRRARLGRRGHRAAAARAANAAR
mmetsp:Transcript_41961/g.125636  ORF Transcript_41961/g.125636 Transcript_41961/m.125636 type:complete len:219 (+) Transcript_41961:887-1543(+)